MNVAKALEIAAQHADRNDSARLALQDAIATEKLGRHSDAIKRACTSIAHSVGVFSTAYASARACLQDTDGTATFTGKDEDGMACYNLPFDL